MEEIELPILMETYLFTSCKKNNNRRQKDASVEETIVRQFWKSNGS